MADKFYVWPTLSIDTPDAETLAVFGDWCEENGFREIVAVRWLFANNIWPNWWEPGAHWQFWAERVRGSDERYFIPDMLFLNGESDRTFKTLEAAISWLAERLIKTSQVKA